MTANERPEEQREDSVRERTGDRPERPRDEPAAQTGWLEAETAEQLLDARLDASQDDPRVTYLARLLAGAVEEADALPGDADREQLVLRAFRHTHRAAGAPAYSGHRPARRRRASRRTQVLVGGIAAVSVLSGVAIAATTGTLPGPFHTAEGRPAESRSAGAASPSSGASGTAGAGRPTLPSSAGASAPSGGVSAHPATPGGSTAAQQTLKGLCVAYLRASQRGEHLDSTAQRRLEAAAGSSAEVASYCARLTADRTPGRGKPTTAAPSANAPKTPAPHVSRPATPAVASRPPGSHSRS
jgi:hypothetical protein